MRLHSWIRLAADELRRKRIDAPELEAQLLAAHVLRVDRAWIIAHPEADLPEMPAFHLLERRLRNEPLAYILGTREFYGRVFVVRKGVLVPRHETETLVEAALELGAKFEAPNVLDLGTGSGCIAATLKLERPSWRVLASDISFDAALVAAENVERLGARVPIINTDLFAGFALHKLHVIVTNPPYVGIGDELPADVRDWEPAGALFAGQSGSDFFLRLAAVARASLVPDGLLVTEIGAGQSGMVGGIFESERWKVVKCWRDLAGVERVLAMQP